MSITKIAAVLGLVLVLPLGWELLDSEAAKRLFSKPSNRPITIQFDNGSASSKMSTSGEHSKSAT